MEDLSAPRMKYKVIGSGKPKKVSKGPWESRIGKGPKKKPLSPSDRNEWLMGF